MPDRSRFKRDGGRFADSIFRAGPDASGGPKHGLTEHIEQIDRGVSPVALPVAVEIDDGSARSTTGYRVYKFLTDSIDAYQYHQETYVNKMKQLTTHSLVDFERHSHGPGSGMFPEFQFGERPETILETLREDSRIEMIAPEEVESVVNAQIRNET